MPIFTSTGATVASLALTAAAGLLAVGFIKKVNAAGLHGAAANAMNAQATSLFKYTAVAGAIGLAALPIGLVVDCLWITPAACCFGAVGAVGVMTSAKS